MPRLPIYIRPGDDGTEHHVGDVVFTSPEDLAKALPAFFRGVADILESQDRIEAEAEQVIADAVARIRDGA